MSLAGETSYEERIVRAVLAMVEAEEARDESGMGDHLVRALVAAKALREQRRLLGHLHEVSK